MKPSLLINFITPILLGFTIGKYYEETYKQPQTLVETECKADSLQSVIYDLQGEREMGNKIRNEEVENLKNLIAKYEFGIAGLDKPNRKEFIRYAMFSDEYSEQLNEDYFEENRKIKQKAGYASFK